MKIKKKIMVWGKLPYIIASAFSVFYIVSGMTANAAECNRTATDTASLNTEFDDAAPGDVICLQSGDYGLWYGGNKAVTVTAADGATPVITLEFNSGDGQLTIDNLTIAGGSILNNVKDVTIRNSDFTGLFKFDNVYSSNILLENNTHININYDPMAAAGRISFPYGSTVHSGVTIRNSLFRGGSADGIQTSVGVNIINNEFDSISEEGDTLAHSDSIQLLGAYGSVVRGNYIHDGSTGIVGYDGVSNVLIENNVVGTSGRTDAIELLSDTNSTIRHNTVLGSIFLGHKPADPAGSGTIIEDNIAMFISENDGSTSSVRRNNLLASAARPEEALGVATYIGGVIPNSYSGFELANGSAGKSAATNGSDIGITIDQLNPTVTITSPAEGDILSGIQPILATASDDTGVTGVTFYHGSTQIGSEDVTAPYSVDWNTTSVVDGEYELTAVARDNAGRTTTSSIAAVSVSNPNGPAINRSIWDDTAIPDTLTINDGTALELGLAFKSSLDGYISGVRFYKSPGDTGSHVGSLWQSDGTKLADVTFSGESSSGWQEALFSNRVPIAADTTYVVSYHNSSGIYPVDGAYFATSGIDRYPLRALQDGESGPNGRYNYSPTSTFPTANFNATNYWVDVVYEPLDTTPPTVIMTAPTTDQLVRGMITLNASANDDLRVEGVQFSQGCPSNCVNIGIEDSIAPYRTTFDTTTLPDGIYTFTVTARDIGDNTSSSSVSLTIDNTAPASSFTQTPASSTSETTARFTFAASESASFQCSLDGSAFAMCPSTVAFTSLARTSHTLRLRAIDQAGNIQGTPVSYSWQIIEVPDTVTAPSSTGDQRQIPRQISLPVSTDLNSDAPLSDEPVDETRPDDAKAASQNDDVNPATDDQPAADGSNVIQAVIAAAPYVIGGVVVGGAAGAFILLRRLLI